MPIRPANQKALLQLEANPPLAHAPATLTQRSANCAPLQTAFQYLVANSLAHVFTNTCTHVRTLPYVYPKRLFVYLLLPHTSRIFPGRPTWEPSFYQFIMTFSALAWGAASPKVCWHAGEWMWKNSRVVSERNFG